MSARCPYEVLEVEPGSSFAEIRRAYERVRAIFGPTSLAVYSLASPEEQRAALLEIEEAYRVLSDPEARQAHDRAHDHPPAPAGGDASEERRALVRPLPGALLHAPAEADNELPPTPAAAQPAPAPVEPPTLAPSLQESPPPAAQPAPPAEPSETPPAAQPLPELAPEQTVSAPRPKAPPLPREEAAAELPPITEETVFTGPLLRTVREARRLTIREIADRTKISPTHLESIEQERWSWLPARVFLRGFLISVARELKLDPEQVSRSFLERRDRAG